MASTFNSFLFYFENITLIFSSEWIRRMFFFSSLFFSFQWLLNSKIWYANGIIGGDFTASNFELDCKWIYSRPKPKHQMPNVSKHFWSSRLTYMILSVCVHAEALALRICGSDNFSIAVWSIASCNGTQSKTNEIIDNCWNWKAHKKIKWNENKIKLHAQNDRTVKMKSVRLDREGIKR